MQQNLSGNDVKCCREEGSFLPQAESGLSYSTTSIYRKEWSPFLPSDWEHLTNEGTASSGKSIHGHSTALTASAPIAHLFPSTSESFRWWAESQGHCIQHPAAEEALVLLLLALLFSSNKKVVMSHSI